MLNSENVPKKSSRSPTKQYKGIFFISITNDFEMSREKISMEQILELNGQISFYLRLKYSL